MPAPPRPPDAARTAAYRYGIVLMLTLATLVFVIVAPSSDWSRATAVALQALALVVALATSRARPEVRRARAVGTLILAGALFAGVGTGLLGSTLATMLGALVGIGVPVALLGGLIALTRERGVTLQAVAGALAIYLQLGLVFAWAIGFAAHVDGSPYFEQGGDGTESDRVYFSFTVLTTTGFGDFTPAGRGGRAIAVVEMLSGQLYLVTVIGVLVGGLVGRTRLRS